MTEPASPSWGHFAHLRPDQLEEIVSRAPIAYWPLGLMEHHGWALPVGFDGIKAERFCERLAARTGGVVLPVMWWGTGGGHADFKWTFYQDPIVGERALDVTVRKLIDFGFRAIIVFAGHYPWQETMDRVLPPIRDAHSDVLLLWGFECSIAHPEVEVPGDHAARWETSYGLALLPELVDMDALRPGRDEKTAWPQSGPPPREGWHSAVEFDASKARFAQAGEDPHLASAEEAERYLGRLADWLATRITEHLAKAR